MISRKLYKLGDLNLVSWQRMKRKLIGENLKKSCYIFSNYLLLQIEFLKNYNHDISKTITMITARSFKLSQLIEDDEEINSLKF